jgi:hypothetical protein
MHALLLQNGENASWRLVARAPSRAGRKPNLGTIAINVHELLWQRDDENDGTFWRPFGLPNKLTRL